MPSPKTRPLALLALAVGLIASTAGSGCDCAPTYVRPDGSVKKGDGGLEADGSVQSGSLTIEPRDAVIALQSKPYPTVKYVVRQHGVPVVASFSIDRVALGVIDQVGTFWPGGTAAGVGTITGKYGGESVSTTITLTLQLTQNGAAGPDGGFGPGGWAGVGGEGPGPAIPDSSKAVLDGAPQSDTSLGFLYPYDQTVWPLGQLAPLLQWKGSPGVLQGAEAIKIHLSSKAFDWKGYFGRPRALAAGAPYQRHPIPQDVWELATTAAAGDTLKVDLTLAYAGKAHGPIGETWRISRGPLKGVVYYQSYGTNLAKNLDGAVGGDGRFGGATLAIKPGKTDPSLVAGKSGGHESCRVCHSVSADGSRMVVQHGEDYERSSGYDLKAGYAETVYPNGSDFKFAGLYPDGSMALLSNATEHFSIPYPIGLYDLATGLPYATQGLTDFVTAAGFPAFSPDGKWVAFNHINGPGNAATGPGNQSKLVAMAFDKATRTFSGGKVLYTGSPTGPPAWPSFMPADEAVVFETVLPGNTSGELFATRYGGKGELWWTDLATGTAHRLDKLNGKGALPTSPLHPDDSVLNYEPTVCPLPSGGYAWVVFMSRRLYGNVATIDPWKSDPREYDHTTEITTKKLWVAAIDLKAPPGTDPSHPAFYLPAQELMAGNTRGFWVVDPCREDGAACDSGDQCCGGYCELDESGGKCTSERPTCAAEFDKCAVSADCCNSTLQCINLRCVYTGPN